MVSLKSKRKIVFPVFGSAVALSLLLFRIFTDMRFETALPNRLQDFFILSTSVIIEALPFVLLGITLSILVRVWLPDDLIFKILPKRRIPRRMVLSALGMFLPVCECGNVPLARGLMVKGLTHSDSLVFLLAAPIINPITIITTHQAFGGDPSILIARLLGGLMIANIVGWLFDAYKRPDGLLTDEFIAVCEEDSHDSHTGKTRRSLDVFIGESNAIMPALFVGSFVAGLVQVAVPRSVLVGLGGHVVLSVVAMIALAFIVSICANVDAFFALAFANTFTAGSLVAFLVFGPVVDIKMLALLRTTYQKRVLLTIAGVSIMVSAGLGLVVNYAF